MKKPESVKSILRERAPYLLAITVIWFFLYFTSGIAGTNNLRVSICYTAVVIASYAFVLLMSSSFEKNFLLLSLLGVFLIFVNPAFHQIDENIHYFKMYSISAGRLMEQAPPDSVPGNLLPRNFDLGMSFATSSPEILREQLSEETAFHEEPHVLSVIPVNHALGSVGIFLARLLRLPVSGILLLGRLWIYLAYILLSFLAIRKTEYCKSLVFTLASLPVAFWFAASFSTDPFLVGGALLFLSVCLRYILADPSDGSILSAADGIALLVGMTLFSSVKYCGYMPIACAFFLIPKTRFPQGMRRKLIAAMCLICAVILVWQIGLLKLYPYHEDRSGDTDLARQAQYIFHHPSAFVSCVIRYLLYGIPSIIRMQQAGIISAIPLWSQLLNGFMLLSAFVAADRPESLDIIRARRIMAVFIPSFLLMSAFTIVSLYLVFTPVGADFIDGIQERYFLPQMLMLTVCFSFSNIRNHGKSYPLILSFLAEVSLLLVVIGTLMSA